MSLFGLAKSQPAKPAQKGQFLKWPPEHFTVVYTLWVVYIRQPASFPAQRTNEDLIDLLHLHFVFCQSKATLSFYMSK